jgi:hypothetical protein
MTASGLGFPASFGTGRNCHRPSTKIYFFYRAGVVQWQNVSFPKWIKLVFSVAYENAS